MRRIVILALLCASACGTAPPSVTLPEATGGAPAPRTCVIPTPPTADDLAAAQAAHGLVGRDALLTDYAKRAFAAKQACNRPGATR